MPSILKGGKFEADADIPSTVFSRAFNLFVQAQDRIEAYMAFLVEASVYRGEIWNLGHDDHIVDNGFDGDGTGTT